MNSIELWKDYWLIVIGGTSAVKASKSIYPSEIYGQWADRPGAKIVRPPYGSGIFIPVVTGRRSPQPVSEKNTTF